MENNIFSLKAMQGQDKAKSRSTMKGGNKQIFCSLQQCKVERTTYLFSTTCREEKTYIHVLVLSIQCRKEGLHIFSLFLAFAYSVNMDKLEYMYNHVINIHGLIVPPWYRIIVHEPLDNYITMQGAQESISAHFF